MGFLRERILCRLGEPVPGSFEFHAECLTLDQSSAPSRRNVVAGMSDYANMLHTGSLGMLAAFRSHSWEMLCRVIVISMVVFISPS